eukprot:Amastigsp_a846071_127.p3 type:complete len:135 gc:universal Amastigsp_a846071_127:832-1236(+)
MYETRSWPVAARTASMSAGKSCCAWSSRQKFQYDDDRDERRVCLHEYRLPREFPSHTSKPSSARVNASPSAVVTHASEFCISPCWMMTGGPGRVAASTPRGRAIRCTTRMYPSAVTTECCSPVYPKCSMSCIVS